MAVEELVGPLPQGWQYTTLGDASAPGGGVQTGPFGSQLHAADYVPVGIPSIMPQNIGDNRVVRDGIAQIKVSDAERLARYRVRAGDIVYSRRGDVERRALIRDAEDGWLCGTGCLRVRFSTSHVDPAFASYYLGDSRVREWIVRHAHGATMPNLNTAILAATPFVRPPLPEQRLIARVLSAFDDKIELNRRMVKTLEAIARAVFEAWFVNPNQPRDVEPNLEAPTVSSADGVPGGWAVGRLNDIAEQRRDLVDPRDLPDDLFDHFSLPAYDDGQRPQAQRGADIKSVKYRVPRGSVLLSKLNPAFPRIWLVEPERHDRPISSTEFLVLVPKPPATREYLYCLLGSADFQGALRALATGTSGSHQRARPADVLDLPVLRPPGSVLAEFGDRVTPLLERSLVAKRESISLAAVRDTLLPKLISGELRVPDAERIAVEVGA